MLSSADPIRAAMKERPASALTLLDAAIVVYLVLPLLIFCGWFKPPVAAVLAALILYATWQMLAGTRWREFAVRPRAIAGIVLLSLGWTALGGVGHFFYANSDWLIRDAVLRDLTATPWPPQYPFEGDFPLILRAPIAFYMPAAVVGWLAGPAVGDFALYLWTALGFALFLCAVTTLFQTPRQRWIAVLLMIAFGGLDLVGWILVKGDIPRPSQHIEAWNYLAQYSSNSTLLFWVPNHALPAWLGTTLILRLWRQVDLARIAPLMTATIPLWSPLAAIGLFPFYVAGLAWRRDYRVLFAIRTSFPFMAMALVVARYVTLDSQAIPGGWAFLDRPFGEYALEYLSLCIIEFGLVAWALYRLKAYDLVLTIAVAVLLLLPLYKFGGANDLVMRGSIPALTVLALATVRPLADPGRSSGWRYALMAVLFVGAVGAAHEPTRALVLPAWPMKGRTLTQSQEMGSDDAFPSLPPHYVARLNQAGLAGMLRDPTPVQPYPAAPANGASAPATSRP